MIKNIIVCIDPGHGGRDSGAVFGGVKEKSLTLSVSMKISAILDFWGCNTQLTRVSDCYVSLAERVKMSKSIVNADIFISIHFNAFSNTSVGGTEVYFNNKGRNLADKIQNELISNLELNNRGIKDNSSFRVLNLNDIPRVLCEPGFLTNDTDREIINSDLGEWLTAFSVSNAVRNYFIK